MNERIAALLPILTAAFTTLFTAAGITGCGGSHSEPAPTVVIPEEGGLEAAYVAFASRFDTPTVPLWFTFRRDQALPQPLEWRTDRDGNGYLRSAGPWWTDPNHAAPGAGYLHLIAFAYHDSLVLDEHGTGQAIQFPDGRVLAMMPRAWSEPGSSDNPWQGIPGAIRGRPPGTISDLRNAVLGFRLRTRDLELPDGSNLYVWFQTYDAETERFVNYAKVGQPLLGQLNADDWREVRVVLTDDDADWLCLGTSRERANTYGCARSVADALRRFHVDLGLVMLLGSQPPERPASGAIDLDDVRLFIPRQARPVTTHDL